MEKMREKELALDLLADVAGGFVQAVALHCFINNIDIAPGGASGMAILLNRLTNLPIGTLTFLINIPLLIASWIYLGKVYSGDKMVSCLFGGVLIGISLAVIFMRGSTTGGGDIAAKLLQKYCPHMQTGKAVMATDLVIILLSMVVFRNIESGLYGLINMVVGTYVIDVILYGMNKSTMITVITEKPKEIADELMDELERGCTFLKSEGAYRKEDGKTVICVLDRKQFYKAKKIVYDIDPRAFMIVSEAQEVYGEGFLDSDWEV